MPPLNYKTVRLARGRHRSPGDGVCVMELASMLAGEPFSDQPSSVSPVVAAFLRAYNDAAAETQRQLLFRFASDALGTRAPARVERQRAVACLRWLREVEPHGVGLGRSLRLRLAAALGRGNVVAGALGRAASHADAAAGDASKLRFAVRLIGIAAEGARVTTAEVAHEAVRSARREW